MASVKTTVKEIFEANGFTLEGIEGPISKAIDSYVRDINAALGELVETVERTVTWREGLVLGHHGVAKKDAAKYSLVEFNRYMAEFDHSTCPLNEFDPVKRTLIKGCPIAQAAFKKAQTAA